MVWLSSSFFLFITRYFVMRPEQLKITKSLLTFYDIIHYHSWQHTFKEIFPCFRTNFYAVKNFILKRSCSYKCGKVLDLWTDFNWFINQYLSVFLTFHKFSNWGKCIKNLKNVNVSKWSGISGEQRKPGRAFK